MFGNDKIINKELIRLGIDNGATLIKNEKDKLSFNMHDAIINIIYNEPIIIEYKDINEKNPYLCPTDFKLLNYIVSIFKNFFKENNINFEEK